MATTFVVGGPQTPKDPGFGVFSPFACCSCPPFGPKTPASCRTRKSNSPAIWPRKSVLTDFLVKSDGVPDASGHIRKGCIVIPHIHRLYVLFLEPRKPPKTPFWASETPRNSVERRHIGPFSAPNRQKWPTSTVLRAHIAYRPAR